MSAFHIAVFLDAQPAALYELDTEQHSFHFAEFDPELGDINLYFDTRFKPAGGAS